MSRFPGRACRFAPLFILCGLALVGAPVALAQEPPPVTVPAEPPSGGGSPSNPDPAPQPPPPPSSPPPAVVSPPPAVFVAPSAPSGPTAAEIAEQQQQAEAERKRREAARKKAIREAREKKEREEARKQQEAFEEALQTLRNRIEAEGGAGYGLPLGFSLAPPLVVPSSAAEPDEAATADDLLGSQPVKAELPQPVSAVVVSAGSSGESGLDGTAPILLGLFALSVILLGLAAVPPWHVHGALAVMLVRRRFELGMLGTAVLVSAAIGLAISVVAG